MRYTLLASAAALLLAFGSGCANNCMSGNCGEGGCPPGGGCGPLSGVAHSRNYTGSGEPTAQVAYPYYTVRGPRDYFLDKPATIGP